MAGLPGSVGSIFISRLSTALHAAALLPSSNTGSRDGKGTSARLVMITLFLVTLPVEMIFLAVLHGLGWLRLPIVFTVFSVLFFCCAVSLSGLSHYFYYHPPIGFIGHHIAIPCSISHPFPLGKKIRPRYIRSTDPLGYGGSHGATFARALLRNCIAARCSFTY